MADVSSGPLGLRMLAKNTTSGLTATVRPTSESAPRDPSQSTSAATNSRARDSPALTKRPTRIAVWGSLAARITTPGAAYMYG